jgi:hypothetical protein
MEGGMAMRSSVVESIRMAVALVSGMPLLCMLFLAVVYYCCLEWLRDALAPRESMPTTRIRTVRANP